ncbi:hypothetical protein SASC598O11_013200 [Snodgrassella alvi SCGC AB-598-O11]|nr:hypothetical protein SASC598O11_013200 [Snodgrassella alvi SCGC AB-598-O11]
MVNKLFKYEEYKKNNYPVYDTLSRYYSIQNV